MSAVSSPAFCCYLHFIYLSAVLTDCAGDIYQAFEAIAATDKHIHFVDGDALYHHAVGGTAREWIDHDDPTVGGREHTSLAAICL